MFFVSEITLPFNTIREALKSFPTWKLMLQSGNEAYFKLPALLGDPDYAKYWQEVEKAKHLYLVPDLMTGIKSLNQGGRIILHALDGMLRAAYKDKPHNFPNGMKTIGGTRLKYFPMIFTKNSPLTPMFKNGVIRSFEKGQYDRLSILWQGHANIIKSDSNNVGLGIDTMVLSAGQVFLIFGLLTALIVLAFFVLICELIVHRKMK